MSNCNDHDSPLIFKIIDGPQYLGPSNTAVNYGLHPSSPRSRTLSSTTDLGKPITELTLKEASVRIISPFEPSNTPIFHRPPSYIKYSAMDNYEDICRKDYGNIVYEIDSEDEDWLEKHGTVFEKQLRNDLLASSSLCCDSSPQTPYDTSINSVYATTSPFTPNINPKDSGIFSCISTPSSEMTESTYGLDSSYSDGTASRGFSTARSTRDDIEPISDPIDDSSNDRIDALHSQYSNRFIEKTGKILREGQVKVSMFETVIDLLEKQAFLASRANQGASHVNAAQYDDTPCRVCREEESDDLNQIVICDGCNVSVHQRCYGCRLIPEGAWLCGPCENKLTPAKMTCHLCGNTGGAFKQMEADGKWVHVQCALWLPHLGFSDRDCYGNVKILQHKSVAQLSHSPCLVCGRVRGQTVKCGVATCQRVFHVTCAQKKSFALIIKENAHSTKYLAWCDQHTPPQYASWRRQKAKVYSKEVSLARRKKQEITIASQLNWCKLAKKPRGYEHQSADSLKFWAGLTPKKSVRQLLVSLGGPIPDDQPVLLPVKQHARTKSKRFEALNTPIQKEPVNPDCPSEELLTQIFHFWTEKRRKNLGIPLLKQLQPSIVPWNHKLVPLSTISTPELQSTYNKMLALKAHLESTRKLVDLTVQRERLKQLKIVAKARLIENLISSSRASMLHILQTVMADFDPNRHFWSSATISHPFDWLTLRKNIELGVYDDQPGDCVSNRNCDNRVNTDGQNRFMLDLKRVVSPNSEQPSDLEADKARILGLINQLESGDFSMVIPHQHPLSIYLPGDTVRETLKHLKVIEELTKSRGLGN